MVVRLAQIADALEIAKIHVETWRVAYRGQVPDAILDGLSVEKRLTLWRKLLTEKNDTIFVAEHENTVVGFCSLTSSRDEDANPKTVAEIVAVYILPEYWRKGAGRSLCDSALAEARHQKYKSVTLWVLASNDAAKRFYEKIGFSSDGINKTDKMADGSELNKIRFCIDLL